MTTFVNLFAIEGNCKQIWQFAKMVGKKKEDFGALKNTTGGNRRDDHQTTSKTIFEPISIDAKNALTVIYMLQSPEQDVVLRAVASLEGYGRRGTEHLSLISSLGIFEFLLPLVHHNDYVVKRFSQKLMGMLSSLEDFRQQMLKVDNILNIFVDILEKETDVVMHEYAALTLAELSSECYAACKLLKVKNCIETLFLRITSTDPDVEKNCLDVMNHLLNDFNGIKAFVLCPAFEIKLLLDLIPSSYPVIQGLAIEVLKQLTSLCKDTTVLCAFRDALGIEISLEILENEEWTDLHLSSLDLLINVVDSFDFCDYLLQSGCLSRLIKLIDTVEDKRMVEKILSVLARMSQTRRGQMALNSEEMDKRFCICLQEKEELFQEPSSIGIANLAQYNPCLDNIMSKNPISFLLEIIINPDKTLSLRNIAAYAVSVLCNEDKRASETLMEDERFENLCMIFASGSAVSIELGKNIIQIFRAISFYDKLRSKAVNENLIRGLMNLLKTADTFLIKDISFQVDALECLSGYLIEREARAIFNSLKGAQLLIDCLHCKYASIREWGGHLVVLAVQSEEFVKVFIQQKGLDWLIAEKNMRYSMPSWQSAIEAIFSNFLPAKFAVLGRLDFQDVTKDGFYVSSRPHCQFFLLENYIEAKVSPIFPIYVANFQTLSSATSSELTSLKSTHSEIQQQEPIDNEKSQTQNLQKYMKGADRDSLENYNWSGSLYTYDSVLNTDSGHWSTVPDHLGKFISDPYLYECLENLKKRVRKQVSTLGDGDWLSTHSKLVCERARFIAELVAEEMSGLEPNPACTRHYKEVHINELKYYLGTNILPLGFIRMGDYLERAVLFKTLSDRIGFPCALVRGCHGRAWVEIAVPIINNEINIEEPSTSNLQNRLLSKETLLGSRSSNWETVSPGEDYLFSKIRIDNFKAFPDCFLKPNAIVDLINMPGTILKYNSLEAAEYRGESIL